MNIWKILGIDPTPDRQAITTAYRSKLADANPEDHPEEFKELRSAYEQALELAKQAARADGESLGEADRWMAQVDRVYRDIRLRRDTDQWRQLLAMEFPAQPANQRQARDRLLNYLTQHFFLPHAVWLVLEETFQLSQNADQLKEIFPPAFIENMVLGGIQSPEQIPFEPMEGDPSCDWDQYFRLGYECFQALSNHQPDKAQDLLAKLMDTGVRHPYTLLAQARLALLKDEKENAQKAVTAFLEQMPQDVQAQLLDAQISVQQGEYSRAQEKLEAILAKDPDLPQARFDLAACLNLQGKKLAAKKIYLSLLRDLPFHQTVLSALDQLNTELLPQLEEVYSRDPEDSQNAMELTWCYHQLQQGEKARQVLAALPDSLAGDPDYENLASKVLLAQGEWESTLAHLARWQETLEQQEPLDQSHLGESVRMEACAHYYLGQKERAFTLLDEAARRWPDQAETWKLRAQFLYGEKHLKEALEAARQYSQREPSDSAGPYLCGQILFRMRRLQESYNAFHQVMNLLHSRDAGCMFYQCRILMMAGQWAEAKEILNQLVQAKITGVTMDFCQGLLAEQEGRTEEAQDHYEAVLQNYQRKDPPDYIGEVIYRLGWLQYSTRDKNDLLALVEEGLQLDPGDLGLLDLKAALFHDLNQIEEAITVRRQICRLAPEHPSAHEKLGRLLQFCKMDFAGAAQAYQQQLKARETATVHNLLGLCLQELEQFQEAEPHFLRAAEMEPQVPAYLANLAELYLIKKDYSKSEEAYLKALALPLPSSQDRIQLRRRYSTLLRRICRWEEAARALDPNIHQEYEYYDCKIQAELWAQAGDFSRAMNCLKEWKLRSLPPEEDFLHAKASIFWQMGKLKEAGRAMEKGARVSRYCCSDLGDLYLALGQYSKALTIFRRLAQDRPGEDNYLDRIAKCLCWLGRKEEAAQAAREGLKALEKNRSRYNKALYYTRKAGLLIAGGQLEEAAAALDQAEHSPFCQFCTYPACKDALALRALLLEARGKLEEALALCAQYGPQFPDETDFSTCERRIRKKMDQTK